MCRRYAILLVVGGAICGCASVQLEGAISCPVAVTADASQFDRTQLGFVGRIQVERLALTQPELMKSPKTDLLTKPIDADAVAAGLNKARQMPAVHIAGVNSPTDMIPWIGEYGGVASLSIPVNAVNEAKNARAQIAHMWGSIPGTSNNFRAGSIPVTSTVALGKLTADDAAFASEVEKTLASGGYDALTLAAYGEMLALLEDPSAESKLILLQQAQEFDTARFISTYFRAYFRGGRLFQVSLDTEALTNKMSHDIQDALARDLQLTDEQKKRIAEAIKGYLQKTCQESKDSEKDACLLSRSLGEDSFVTRAGLGVQFAGVSISIGDNGKLAPALTYPQSTEFGPQLVRVFMEAVFDSQGLIVPAVSNATACKAKLYPKANCLSDEDAVVERIKKLDMYAGQAEATVTAATSKAIRGWAVFALNNEAIAKSLETMAGVSARKIVEKALWNRYRVGDSCADAAGTVAVWVRK